MKPKFSIGQIVFHKAGGEEAGIITGVTFRSTSFTYLVTWADREEAEHYEFELTTEKEFKP